MQNEFSSKSRDGYQQRIDAATLYIAQNLSLPLDLETIARVAGFSRFHFHRIFSAMTGETLQGYITRLRLERAANLVVKSPSMSITEVAFACGFSSPAVFARSFKQYFGVSAREFARNKIQIYRAPAWVVANAWLPEDLHLEVRVIRQPAMHLAYFSSQRGYDPISRQKSWDTLFAWANARGLFSPQSKVVGISYDDPEITPAEKCRYLTCLEVPENINFDRRANFLDLPEMTCAVCRVETEEKYIKPAIRWLYCQWLPESGFIPADQPCIELYLAAPEQNASKPYVLDICLPIETI